MSKPNAPSRVSGAVAPDKTCPYDNPAGNRKCEVERAKLGAPASLWERDRCPGEVQNHISPEADRKKVLEQLGNPVSLTNTEDIFLGRTAP